MIVRRPEEVSEIEANDGCRLRELLHPARFGPDLPYSLAVARVEPGQATHRHYLDRETEVYYLLEGRGRMHVGAETADVQAGDVVVVPAGAEQWIECVGDRTLRFLNLVSPPWHAEHDVRIGPGA